TGDKAGGSQEESSSDKQPPSHQDSVTGGSQADKGETKATAKEKPSSSADRDGTKAQEKRAGTDTGDAGNQAAAKPEHQEKSQNSTAQGKTGGDKSEEQGKAGSESGREDKTRTQQSGKESTGGKAVGEKSKDDVSALSKALRGSGEKE